MNQRRSPACSQEIGVSDSHYFATNLDAAEHLAESAGMWQVQLKPRYVEVLDLSFDEACLVRWILVKNNLHLS